MQFSANAKFGPEKCPVYLKLPWIGYASLQLIEQIKRSVSCCFNVVNLCFNLKSNALFSPNLKDSVSMHLKSFLIYEFHSKCNICYISHTIQRLENRIKHVIHSNGLTRWMNFDIQNLFSSITQHLLDSSLCADTSNLNMFTILKVSNNELQLSVVEALLITKHQPVLCEQKEFYKLLLFNPKDLVQSNWI